MISFIALGDSITAGKSATSPLLAYPSLTASILQKQSKSAQTLVLARPGWTSSALLSALRANSPLPLQQATTISVWIGGNDIAGAGYRVYQGAPRSILQKALCAYEENLNQILSFVRRWNRGNLVVCTQYNPFPNTAFAEEGIEQINLVITKTANRHQAQLAPTHTWFAGNQSQLIAGYRTGRLEDVFTRFPFGPKPIHPNNKGHMLIAENLSSYYSFPR